MLEYLLVQQSVSFASIKILYNSDSYSLKSSDQIMEQRLFSSRVPHLQLQRVYNSQLQDRNGYLPYFYDSCTENQRIESWWGQLTKGLLFRWRVNLLFYKL